MSAIEGTLEGELIRSVKKSELWKLVNRSDHSNPMIWVVPDKHISAHTNGDSTLAESSTGNTRLADSDLTGAVGFLVEGFTDEIINLVTH